MSTLASDYKQLANAIISHTAPVVDPFTVNPEQEADLDAARIAAENGIILMFGPFEVIPGLNHEVPLGRDYQPLEEKSVSRLAGFLGRDEYGLVIREVPDKPELGLRPSRSGIWVRQPGELHYRRLAPGEAVRITRQSEIRVGGNGRDAESGLQIFVV